ncbi:lantibiotic dehydratase [Frankia sp. CcI49]|uniref:lantibiotic dehydratase n=1 Tax=Frankia sp. CcI49 TaxID=1745382 RepID=UPI000A00DC4F|nr:lantibiotic dehydratase [Frankia sp. CcI49]
MSHGTGWAPHAAGPVGRVPIGDGSRWALWDLVELRTAGFPAADIAVLFDPGLAELAAGDDEEKFLAAYAQAVDSFATVARRVASGPRFQEAVTWQNPTMFRDCVAKIAEGTPSRPAHRRRRELKVVSYLQRYALKNDTIGFFGPVGFARVAEDGPALRQQPGPALLARRRVYFEQWAIDAVARRISADPEVLPWLRPRRSAAVSVRDGLARRPHGAPIALTRHEAEIFELCDGSRTAAEIAGFDAVAEAWLEAGLITLEIDARVEDDPEVRLREEVLRIGDATVRDRVLTGVDELIAARDAVAACAGDAARLATAGQRLDEVFERLAGEAASRRGGEAYAGRRVIYEDTVRDVEVRIGPEFLAAAEAPLELLLDSARWLVAEAAQAYRERFDRVFDACLAAGGDSGASAASQAGAPASVPTSVAFGAFLAAATPDLAFSYRELPDLVAALIPEFQRRWATILAVPSGVRRHELRSADLLAAVRAAFPLRELPWSSAVHHCPDIMVAAASTDAVNRGDFLLILGELHLTANTLDARVVLQQHPEPEELTAADARDRRGPRIQPVPAKASSSVNSRVYPPAMRSSDDLFWTLHTRHTGAAGQILPGAGLRVHREQGVLRVRFEDRACWDLLEVLGEIISAAVMNAFKPIGTAGHRPRVTIDRMVIAREAWGFAPGELRWAFEKDAARCYRGAQAWRRAAGLPPRAFYRVAVEDKPLFVDFSSVALVRLLATAVRSAAEEEPDSLVGFTEMLPDLGEHWVRDAAGAAYASELRLVAVDLTERP